VGKKIALKDNICVAGVPMMNGSAVLEGFVPDVDATIVTRILDAGGEIIVKRSVRISVSLAGPSRLLQVQFSILITQIQRGRII